jgi:transcription antitermination factor NusA-like protein
MGVLMTLRVHPEDMGKVIGRSGKTAQAIRILLRVVGMRHHAHVSLTIEEPEGGQRPLGTSTPLASRSVDAAMEELKAL